MEDENDQEISEDAADQGFQEDQQDLGEFINEQQEEQSFGNYPGQPQKSGVWAFFTSIIGLKDSTKVANLDKRELGNLDLSVRSCEYLSKLGHLLHNRAYRDFFMSKAEITLATSMSKKGWLPELVVSQKRFSQRAVQPIAQLQQKKSFLGFGKKPQPQQQ